MTVCRALRRSSRRKPIAGIMPNAAASDVPRLHDRRSLRTRHRRVRRSGAVLRPGTDGRRRRTARRAGAGSRAARAGRDSGRLRARMAARRPLGRRQSLRVSRASERDGRLREDARLGRRRAASCPWGLCRLARAVGRSAWATSSRTPPSGSGRRPDSGWRSDRCGSCSGGCAIIATASKKNLGNPLLVIVGHSFGGMIVFSALAQSLIQAASAPVGQVTPEFADLVLLVNPAIEGARYIPIYDLVTSPAFKARTTKQLPVFICAQAENDQPVGTVFPLGNAGHAITEATIGDLEKWCVTHALGFVPSLPHPRLGWPDGQRTLRADASRHRASQSVLGGRSGEGSDRRTRRHLADAVPSVHREPRLPARAGFEARTEGDLRVRAPTDLADRAAISRSSRSPSARSDMPKR